MQTTKDIAQEQDREDAVISLRTAALRAARELGESSQSRGANPFFYDHQRKVQARSLVFDVLIGLYSLDATERRILAALRALDRHNCDDHEGLYELWNELIDAADEARDGEACFLGDAA